MNHKRKRPKHQRAGCLMCKPQKDERVAKSDRETIRDKRFKQQSKEEEY